MDAAARHAASARVQARVAGNSWHRSRARARRDSAPCEATPRRTRPGRTTRQVAPDGAMQWQTMPEIRCRVADAPGRRYFESADSYDPSPPLNSYARCGAASGATARTRLRRPDQLPPAWPPLCATPHAQHPLPAWQVPAMPPSPLASGDPNLMTTGPTGPRRTPPCRKANTRCRRRTRRRRPGPRCPQPPTFRRRASRSARRASRESPPHHLRPHTVLPRPPHP